MSPPVIRWSARSDMGTPFLVLFGSNFPKKMLDCDVPLLLGNGQSRLTIAGRDISVSPLGEKLSYHGQLAFPSSDHQRGHSAPICLDIACIHVDALGEKQFHHFQTTAVGSS